MSAVHGVEPDRRPLLAAGLLLGVGMGGFVDGIVFHQILQLHNMLSAVRPPSTLVDAKINMVWDGLFHAGTWTATAVGLALLWRAVLRPGFVPSTRSLVGSILAGWGLFNAVEGAIDHHLLGIHHVVEGPGNLPYDLAFLASGAILLIIGRVMVAADPLRPATASETTPR